MKRLKELLRKGTIVSGIALLCACSDDNPWRFSNGEGGISPTVTPSTVIHKSTNVRAESSIEAPDVNQFGLTLTKSDGSYSKTWASTSLFPTDEGFPVGTYTMSAFYGSIDDEGFERPFFYGAEQVQVLEDRTSEVNITASLANTMVSIVYTEAFTRYFSNWQAKLHSEGGSYIDYPRQETRAAYLRPGHVDVALTITKPNGVTATLQPADFDALPQHHYRITFDVYEGEVGEAQLVIIFDDTLEEEDITIDLSDELLTASAPEVQPQGFTAGETLELLELSKPENPVRYFIRAASGISAATMTLQSTAELPLGNEFDFCSLSVADHAILLACGIKETGLSRNPGTLAQVDLTDYIATLPAGTHKFTMVVKDKMAKINEPLELSINSIPLTFEVGNVSMVPLGQTIASMTISTNASDLKEGLIIKGMDDYGTMQNCQILSIQEQSAAPRNANARYPVKQYSVTFTIPQSNRDIKLQVSYKGLKNADATVSRELPEYTVEGDAFAHKAILRVKGNTDAETTLITNLLRVFHGNTELTVDSRDAAHGLITVSGLAAATEYTLGTTIVTGSAPAILNTVTLTTETEAAIPNGDFETLQETFNATALNQGGTYTRMLISSAMQNHQAYTISEPAGWASTNPKTMNPSASVQNSWFVVASVFNTSLSFVSTQATQGGMGGSSSTPAEYTYSAHHGSNAMVIRNTAWDHSGTLPDVDKKTATPANYYSTKIPTIGNRSAGLLFLGSYSYNGIDNINEGTSFSSRPSTLQGYYRYIPDSQDSTEKATVTIKLMNGNTVIGQGTATLGEASDYTLFTVPVTYTTYFMKADRLCVMFSSSNRNSSEIKTTSRAQRYLQESTGAVLVVDNLSFTY